MENPGRTVKGFCWTFTHHVHDGCSDFPMACKELRSSKSRTNIVGGGWGNELGEDGVTPHIQGWIATDSESTFGLIRGSFCQKIHWEKMHGSIESNITYCSKEGIYSPFGVQDGANPHERSGSGARNDLAAVHTALKNGKRMVDISNDHFGAFIKFNRGFMVYQALNQKPVAIEECFVSWGEAGAGKSWGAKELIAGRSVYQPGENLSGLLSFESYDGQEVILLEDFSAASLGVCALKRILIPTLERCSLVVERQWRIKRRQ